MSNSPLKARLLIRKLRRRHLLDTRIIVGFWAAPAFSDEARNERLSITGADLVVTRLQEAVAKIKDALSPENDAISALTQAAADALLKVR